MAPLNKDTPFFCGTPLKLACTIAYFHTKSAKSTSKFAIFAQKHNYACYEICSELSSVGILSGGCAEGIPALQSMRWESEEAPLQDGR